MVSISSFVLTRVRCPVGIRLIHGLHDCDQTFFFSSLLKILLHPIGAGLLYLLDALPTLEKKCVLYDEIVVFESFVKLVTVAYCNVQKSIENGHGYQQRTQRNVVVLVLLVSR